MANYRIHSAIGILILTATAAFSNMPSSNTFWFRNSSCMPESTKIPFYCAPGGIGCLITSGPNAGRQLYTGPDLLTPLGHHKINHS
jgi:hypothetical protein